MSLRRGSMRCRDSRQISREVAAGVHQAQNAVPAVTFAEPKELLKDNFGKHEIIADMELRAESAQDAGRDAF